MAYKPAYGIENFLDEIMAMLKANLNSYITDMNSAKGDFDLPLIDDAAYYAQTLNDEHVNYDDFVFVFEEQVSTESVGPRLSETYTVIVSIVSNYGNDATGTAYKKAAQIPGNSKRPRS